MTVSVLKEPQPKIKTLIHEGGIGTVSAMLLNLLLYKLGSFDSSIITAANAPLQAFNVILLTVLSGIAAIIGYIVLTRFLAPKVARPIMWGIALVAFILLAFGPPTGITGIGTKEIILLEIMHIVALLPVHLLTREP